MSIEQITMRDEEATVRAQYVCLSDLAILSIFNHRTDQCNCTNKIHTCIHPLLCCTANSIFKTYL